MSQRLMDLQLGGSVYRGLVIIAVSLMIASFVTALIADWALAFLAERWICSSADCLVSLAERDAIDTIKRLLVLCASIALTLPIALYQFATWAGSYRVFDRQYLPYLLVPVGLVFFLAGMYMAFSLIIPEILAFLGGFYRPIPGEWQLELMLLLIVQITFWTGIAFELPVVMALLAAVGRIPWRRWLGWWRHAIVFGLIWSALITPTPDPINMLVVAMPLPILYAAGIGLAWVVTRHIPQERAT